MRIIQPRLLSNKENATISPDLAAATSTDTPLSYLAKPRVSGIGRAPPKRNHPHQSHSPYPRARTTSVQRAKLRSAKIHKIKHNLKPNPVSEKPSDDMLSLATQKRRHRQPDRTVRIPLQLPKPAIPPVGVLDGKLDGVPAEFVLNRLRPFMISLFAISQLYRPRPDLNHRQRDVAQKPDVRPTMVFAIPDRSKSEEVRARMKAMGPDVCLAVTKRCGQPGQLPRIYAVSEVVLKAHCAYWPKLTASSRLRSHQPLTPISESTECDHSESESNSESDSGSSTEVESDHPSSSSHTRIDTTVCVLHLPIIDLCLPSPETFPILLVHLHASTRPLVPKLLGISSLTLTRRDILVELEKFTLPELMEKLAYIHAMWKNVCALGISDEGTWNQMAMAWSCVVSVVAGMGGGWAWAEEMKAKAMA